MSVLAPTLGPLGKASGVPADADVTAFLTAAEITDPTISDAIETLVLSLKEDGIWTKLDALYPLVGGSASTHKWNLKDPRDLDAAFRLTFHGGGWTHNANGITPNGSSYANTYWNPSVQASASNGSMGTYCRTQNHGGGTPYDMGASAMNDLQATLVIGRYANDRTYATWGTDSYASSVDGATDGRAFWTVNRNGSSNTEGYKNGSRIINAADSVTLPNYPVFIGCNNRGGTPSYHSTKNTALVFCGDGMSQSEQADLNTAVQAFQTSLGRQV